MKVTAYLTNCCNCLKDEDSVKGVIYTKDMFDNSNSFITVKPELSQIHYCVQCYTTHVTEAAKYWLYKEVEVKENGHTYIRKVKCSTAENNSKLKELAFIFKKTLFNINELTIV